MATSRKALTVASVVIGGVGAGLVVVAAAWGGTLLQVSSSAIAALALVVAALALNHSARAADAASRSAAIAEDQEQRRKYGWAIELVPDSGVYELRNTGSLKACSVRLDGDFFKIGFLHEQGGNTDTVDIDAGEARVFDALTSYGDRGLEVEIIWRPEGEIERRWREVIPPRPRAYEDRTDQRREAGVRAEEHRRENIRDLQQRLLHLGDAYAQWKADPTDAGKKLNLQLLVAALPPGLAREIGYVVDVARDVWGPEEYPLDSLVPVEDRHLIEDEMAEIELMWNMRQVTGYEVYGPTDNAAQNTEPGIRWAVMGYAERRKERRSGERKLRRSPAEQRRYDADTALLESLTKRVAQRENEADQPE